MIATHVTLPPVGVDPALVTALFAALGPDSARYVGGWVRDTLLGLSPQDIDLATVHAPDAVTARLDAADLRYWTTPSGVAHGTVTAMLGPQPVEITTLRHDVSTDGRHAQVAFTDDWRADAARRDFTINALSADPVSGVVHDYFGGLADLDQGLVRFIGDPLIRIAEDHLRILRFFRFHARFGRGAPDPASFAACSARANDLMALSRERIAVELLKLLALPDPTATVDLMISGGLFVPVLPEIDAAALPRLSALVAAEAAANIPPDGLRRLAALLPVDPAKAEGVGQRLKLSKQQVLRLKLAATRDPVESPAALAYRVRLEPAIDRLLLTGGDVAALDGWERPVLGISGGDLIAMGLAPGPLVARTLHQIERSWSDAGFPPDRVADIARAAVERAKTDR
ncbi:CCA tRNA nucleotidyltransferase [Sphingomonas prati]|uniref:Poly(A) polymerase n=1 Tax=Sphingomonas prati TaxID=1843237 RepID=A0A7W9BQ06_9SPHN|nr:CCA tRNA nucleotidyltransferase [Sphingomonas prati]MBB5727900.1 poly(A) polymerase [Sphingomonas prati]GGE81693.1 cytidine(C)-cytidine(C)-adenosine (A)]-adding enzyme [Sphingomonas prati]